MGLAVLARQSLLDDLGIYTKGVGDRGLAGGAIPTEWVTVARRRAVADDYDDPDVARRALETGCDALLLPRAMVARGLVAAAEQKICILRIADPLAECDDELNLFALHLYGLAMPSARLHVALAMSGTSARWRYVLALFADQFAIGEGARPDRWTVGDDGHTLRLGYHGNVKIVCTATGATAGSIDAERMVRGRVPTLRASHEGTLVLHDDGAP